MGLTTAQKKSKTKKDKKPKFKIQTLVLLTLKSNKILFWPPQGYRRVPEVQAFLLTLWDPSITSNQFHSGHVCSLNQGLVKGYKFCFRNLDFYFQHGESTSTASKLTSPASQKSKDLNKVSLLLQDLG